MKEIVRIIDWRPEWSGGAPMPQLFSSENRTFLIYHTINSEHGAEEIAIVEFLDTLAHKFGVVNDEALSGHPLYHNGLDFYKAHEVENSSWLDEIRIIHQVHPKYSEEHWNGLRHFILTFQDSTLEIIAKGYQIETTSTSMATTGLEIVNKINGQN